MSRVSVKYALGLLLYMKALEVYSHKDANTKDTLLLRCHLVTSAFLPSVFCASLLKTAGAGD